MTNIYKSATIILVIVLIIWVAFSLQDRDETASDEPFNLGALLCLTGTCSEWGENSLDGVRLAVEEINKSGGILGRQVEIIVQDSAEDSRANAVSGSSEAVSSLSCKEKATQIIRTITRIIVALL